MKTATVSQLKKLLSAYLRQVKTGEEVLITEHGRPIARLLPIANPASLSEHLQDTDKESLPKRGEACGGLLDPAASADPQGAVRLGVSGERESGR